MNPKNILLAATLAGGLLSASVLSAAVVIDSPVLAEGASYSAPELVKIVNPAGISRRYQAETIRVSVTVDATGQAHNVSLLSASDPILAKQLLPVVAKWHFAPAKKNGQPVSADIVLPIQLVDTPAS